MVFYLKCSKAYDCIQKSGVIVLPHPKTLQGIKKNLCCREGGDRNIYNFLLNEMKQNNNHKLKCRHLMFDELKIKNDIAYNSTSNEIFGCVDNEFNT